jgi:hypothetical protein
VAGEPPVIKTLMIAIWCCGALVGANFGATFVMQMQSKKDSATPENLNFETRKSRELSIPIIRDGGVKGYVVVQLNYVVDLEAAKKLQAPPEAFVVDETFQLIYGDEKIDFSHLDRLDLGRMTETLIQRINTRLRTNVITDMGVIAMNFLVNSDANSPKPKL